MNVTSKMFKDQKKRVIVESNLRLLLEVVRIFVVLEFLAIWMCRMQLKNYSE
jgi:hypothetical protein